MKNNHGFLKQRYPHAAGLLAAMTFLGMSGVKIDSAELIYQEGFNTDGEATVPQRYTTEGRDAFEVERIRADLGLQDQLGPIYWAHNFDVSFVGVPGPTPARRMLLAWDSSIDGTAVHENTWKLLEATVKWLVNNKAGAKIVVPDPSRLGAFGDRLAAAGYVLVNDDPGVTDENLHTLGDLFIHAPGSSNASRGARATIPVIDMLAADRDDMLTSSIGVTASFEPGPVTITAPEHPAAGGLSGTFPLATTTANWELIGDILPNGAITLANFVRFVPPTISSLADVDAMIAGTKAGVKTTGVVQVLDFSDNSSGNWFSDDFIPGFATGIWGLHAKGKLNVTVTGTYSFALGTDDGGRLQIDLNKNGSFESNETIITDLGPHAHSISYGDATFSATGEYNYQVVAYNSGSGGSVELSVSAVAGANRRNLATAPETWVNVGDPFVLSAPVVSSGTITVDAYVPAGEPEAQIVPFIVLLNGPNDVPAGSVFGGGAFTGFEGNGFFAMSGGNKWPLPEGRSDRTLTLRPVDVRGKENLKLTIALAATFLDFETSDRLDIVAYPHGIGGEEIRLARFSAPSGNAKYFVDVDHGNKHRLGLSFQNVTYDIPPGATDLVIQLRAITTWWNEILAFDNIRITSGVEAEPIRVAISKSGQFYDLTWTGGTGPFAVQWASRLGGNWIDLATTPQRSFRGVILPPNGFLQIVDGTTKDIRAFHAILSGAAERPAITTPGSGVGLASVDMNSKTVISHVWYTDLKLSATMAHIHGPADVNSSAGILIGLSAVGDLGTSGVFAGTAVATDTQFNAITSGNSYFNVHSSAHGGGEIRGQIVPIPAP